MLLHFATISEKHHCYDACDYNFMFGCCASHYRFVHRFDDLYIISIDVVLRKLIQLRCSINSNSKMCGPVW